MLNLNKTQHNVIGIKGDKEKKYRKFGIDTPTFTKAKEREAAFLYMYTVFWIDVKYFVKLWGFTV